MANVPDFRLRDDRHRFGQRRAQQNGCVRLRCLRTHLLRAWEKFQRTARSLTLVSVP